MYVDHSFFSFSETVHKFFGHLSILGPMNVLTPCALILSRGTYYFNDEKAQRLLGYQPIVSMAESVDISVKFYKPELANNTKSKSQ